MSLINPNKLDDLYNCIYTYNEFLKDPKVRNDEYMFNYFKSLIEDSISLLYKITNDRIYNVKK